MFCGKDWIFELLCYLPTLIYPSRSEIFYSHFKLQFHHSDPQSLMEMGIWLLFIPFPVLRFGAVSSPPEIKKAALPITHRLLSRDLCIHMGIKMCKWILSKPLEKHRKLYKLPPFIPLAKAPTVCFISGYCILTNYP